MVAWLVVVLWWANVSSLQLRQPAGRASRLSRSYRRLDGESEDETRRLPFRLPPRVLVTTRHNPVREKLAVKTTLTEPNSQPLPKNTVLTHVDDLRRQIYDHQIPYHHTQLRLDPSNRTVHELLTHDVLQLMAQRFREQSVPGHRTDDARLALSLEGGGMRGAVGAGMAAAIACLGLTDTLDVIYGSSAGSVVGAYLVSRQVCMDVYVDILTAAKKLFVCTKRMLSTLACTGLDWVLEPWLPGWMPKLSERARPGMNISFVLDGIMDHEHGIRPLDLERFLENDRKQPLRIASSYIENGKLYTKCFGTQSFDPASPRAARRAEGPARPGIYTCLEASMTVPGATGPPVPIQQDGKVLPYFDAFCFEPLPYRSAVEEGATHVLCLCSRPEGFQPVTKPGLYEKGVAPLYFRSHGYPEVASFFDRGGQQFIYAEDLLTLEAGKNAGIDKTGPIAVPPPKVLYGVDEVDPTERDRTTWNKAHLLPLKVPLGTTELPTLSQDRGDVVEAVRGGFSAAFNMLGPIVGIDTEKLRGEEVAKLVFPLDETHDSEAVLRDQLRVQGAAIASVEEPEVPSERSRGVTMKTRFKSRFKKLFAVDTEDTHDLLQAQHHDVQYHPDSMYDPEWLLNTLPGLQSGGLAHLSRALRETAV